MGFNMDFYEKEHQAHYQDLLREAEKERMLSHLPRHRRSRSRSAAGKLGVLLLRLGADCGESAIGTQESDKELSASRAIIQ
jgi:hypothetical protein